MVYRRRSLRQRMTTAEEVVWNMLRRKRLGYKFKRQFSIDNYVVDFYCPDCRLAIELDGGVHRQRRGYDEYRTRTLNAYGVVEIRFSNEQVFEEPEDVIKRIYLSVSPSPMLRRGNQKGEVIRDP